MALPFRKTLFWDVDITKTDYQKYAPFIIGRVLESGNLEDYKAMRRLYTEDVVKKAARQHKFTRPRDVNFWSLILGIAKEDFLCTRKPSLLIPRAFSAQ